MARGRKAAVVDGGTGEAPAKRKMSSLQMSPATYARLRKARAALDYNEPEKAHTIESVIVAALDNSNVETME